MLIDECPLCHKPDSCTRIAGECPYHKALTINQHNAARQLIHEAIRETAKGGEALHNAPDLVILTSDTGSHPRTTRVSLEALLSATTTEDSDLGNSNTPRNWLEPLPLKEETCHKRHTDVSRDMRNTDMGFSAAEGDAECTEAPTRIPPWVLPPNETKKLFEDGHGTAPNIIYAKIIPATPDPDLNNVNKMRFTLILVEVEFCRNLGCDNKLTEKTEK